MGRAFFFTVVLLVSSCAIGADLTKEVSGLTQQVVTLFQQGKYAEALPLSSRILILTEKESGPDHPDTATALQALASLHMRAGNFTNAQSLYERCLKIREHALGVDNPATAFTLYNLGALYQALGKNAKAELLLLQCLKTYKKIVGPDHPSTALVLNNLGLLYQTTGNYAKAESFFQSCLKIREQHLGPDDNLTGGVINNLALLYQAMGDYAKAEPMFQRCLKINEKAVGTDHPDRATILDNLAVLYIEMKEFAKAEPLFLRSLEIRKKFFGLDNNETATSLNNLAGLYSEMGNNAKAVPLYEQCLDITDKILGPDHLDTTTTLNNLASSYSDLGEYAKAESMFLRCLKINEKVLGANHLVTTKACSNLCITYLDSKQPALALPLARRFETASEKNLGMILAFTSERQRMVYASGERRYDLLATLGSSPDLAEALLRTKGVVLDSLLEDQLVAGASKDAEIKKTVDQLRLAGRHLNQLQMEIPEDVTKDALKRRQTALDGLELQVEDLQKTLARNVAGMGQTRRSLRITVGEVQAVLPNDAALLEFVRYRHYPGKGKSEQRYGAVLIGHPQMTFKDAKPGEPVWVPLGSAKTIEQSLKEYGSMMRGAKGSGVNLLHKLYTQLFEPIQKRLPKDITTLIISPDAELNFVSFATFINDQNQFLAEQYAIEYVSSGRDLVLKRTSKKTPRRFAAFANPAFGEKPLMAGAHDTNAVQLAMLSSDQRDYRGEILKPLPNTLREAQFLRDRSSSWNMDGSVYAGAEATEVAVKAVKSPYILHLATHGFFLDDKLTTTNQLAKGRFMLGNDRAPIVPHNPMQRSGLAFAGAQLTLDAWKRGETPDTENDGILMGQEIGTMDLKETWLVVLSACDTGMGEARAGEGVLGLRRGFIQAGAQNLLMTLWPVSDKWTVDLMKAFYERALTNSNAPQALAEVQRDFLVKVKNEMKNAVLAARLAGPFVMTSQGRN